MAFSIVGTVQTAADIAGFGDSYIKDGDYLYVAQVAQHFFYATTGFAPNGTTIIKSTFLRGMWVRSDITTGTGQVVQTQFVEQAGDVSIPAGNPFTDLFSLNITVQANSKLILLFSVSASSVTNPGADIFFALNIDGVQKRATAVETGGTINNESAALNYETGPLTAGAHTVKIQWKSINQGGAIHVASNPDAEHASLVVMEVTT